MDHNHRWTLEKLKRRMDIIAPLVYRKISPLPTFKYLQVDGPEFDVALVQIEDLSQWAEVHPHEYWAPSNSHFVLRTTFTIPPEWGSSEPIALYLPLGDAHDFSHPEALAWIDGNPYAACDRHHQEIILRREWADGKAHKLCLQGWTGYLGGAEHFDPFAKLYMRECTLAQIYPPARELVGLSRTAIETASLMDENDPVRHNLLSALDNAFQLLDLREPLSGNFYHSLEAVSIKLKEGIENTGSPLDVRIYASGHAHLDVAWLWTIEQARQKAARTFHNVLRLMDQFPDFHHSQSQPQLYEFVRQDFPDLFKSIQERVAEGRWEPLGGMWVEADCNLSGAESLARQFLLGRRYFKEYFGAGAESPVLWLPDVFGYAWALPQLIQQAGLRYFMTIKIGWSEYNRFPYDTFLWQGLDGTQILTHFSTVKEPGSPYASTYNSMANASESLGAWINFQQKDLHKDLLMAYGFGDGGGGPTREMLENINIMKHFPGLPQLKHSSVKEFFETLEPLRGSPKMPVWDGELYLEYHRGTYTSQARNKRANRKSEFLLHDAEFLASFAALLNPDYVYPSAAFDAAWHTLCLNQFHDILPGSSINPVYTESLAEYAQLTEDITRVRDEALSMIRQQVGGDIILINPTSFSRSDPAYIPGLAVGDLIKAGQTLTTQIVEGGPLVDQGELLPYSLVSLSHIEKAVPKAQSPEIIPQDEAILENDLLRVEFNLDGDITRILDKQGQREIIPPGSIANQMQAFEDRPRTYDAWDIEAYYDEKLWLAEPADSIQRIENGPLRETIEIKRRILNSEFVQRISLVRGSRRLDFDTTIEWRERHILLKAAFPVEVLAPQATYEIQWGSVQRPTHRNTSWDWARFETCAHKWVDLSEGGYGVSLLNDCKYGHDIHGNVLRITLLRSPTQPDPVADLGEHHFIYSLLPHNGQLDERTTAEAYALNDPILSWHTKRSSEVVKTQIDSLVSMAASNIIIETIKQAEDGQGWIVRMYESQRKRGTVMLKAAFPIAKAWETNLLEENEVELQASGNCLQLEFSPFQIMTLRIEFARNH